MRFLQQQHNLVQGFSKQAPIPTYLAASQKFAVSSATIIMWTLNRTGRHIRVYSRFVRSLRVPSSRSQNVATTFQNADENGNELQVRVQNNAQEALLFLTKNGPFWRRQAGVRGFASQSDFKDEDAENENGSGVVDSDAFSELESPPKDEEAEGILASEDDVSEADEEEEEEEEGGVKSDTALAEVVESCKFYDVVPAMERWLSQGNVITRSEVAHAFRRLRKRRMYDRALKLSHWLFMKKPFNFDEVDYVNHVDLTSKVYGVHKGQKYVESMPSEFRGYKAHRSLLANCASVKNIQKGEDVFNKMKELGFHLEIFDYNQMLLLYKQSDKRKIVNILSAMESEGIKPDLLTYKFLVDAKGLMGDVSGMEEIIENMKAEGLEPDGNFLVVLARNYKYAGLKDKVEAALKEAEKYIETDKRLMLSIITLYADIGKMEDVERLAGDIEALANEGLRLKGYIRCIASYGKVDQVEKAESYFEKIASSGKLSVGHYNAMLNVYAERGLISKAKALVKRMAENGRQVESVVAGTVVKLYIKAGDLEKADSVLSKVCGKKGYKPMYGTLILLLKTFAEKGDIANAEKYFQKLRRAGYVGKIAVYDGLLQAYVNAGVPAYGFRERLMADKFVPNRRMNEVLQKLETSKEPTQELLDLI